MISNPRDLVVQLLGGLLFVERRLSGQVLNELRTAVRDDELRSLLARHRDETEEHARRIETLFHRMEVAPTANLSRAFESGVAEHQAHVETILDPRLADLFHAHAALQTEHWEMAGYQSVLPLLGPDQSELLAPSLDEEHTTAKLLAQAIDRLSHEG